MRSWLAPLAALPLLAGTVAAAPPVEACLPGETTIWWCQAGRSTHLLCASADLGPGTGSLQYRVRRAGTDKWVFPAERRPPRGAFELRLLARGASLELGDDRQRRAIFEPLAGSTTIDVTRHGRASPSITCRSSSDTLTLTTTQQLFERLGLMR